PTSPLGTYPSGGCDRVIVFYGLIAYLLWREFSGQRRSAVWLAGGVAALGFNEAYSRVYLSLHWTTDAVSGLLYGTLLLAVFVTAVHLVAGPPIRPSGPPSPLASTASVEGGVSLPSGGSGGLSSRASTAGGSGGSSPRASTAGGSGGSSPRASTAGQHR
ncbi:MAG TPA: phosphatase PAP2 family protein, partial [Streptosporangiaceae bacterium]